MKKKILLLSTFIIVAVLVLCNFDKKEVKAEDNNCQTYYNYYLFLDGSTKKGIENIIDDPNQSTTTGGVNYGHYTTYKEFNLEFPEEANIKDAGLVELYNEKNLDHKRSSGDTIWSMYEFFTIFERLKTGEVETGKKSYVRASAWFNKDQQLQTGSQTHPGAYDNFNAGIPKQVVLSSGKVNQVADVTISVHERIGNSGLENSSTFKVDRTFTHDMISHIDDNGYVYSPAVYYVKYDICEEETPTYTLTVEHLLDDETNKKLKDNFVDTKKYKTGEDYEYNCPAIDGYTVVNSSNKPSTVDGTFEDKDITKQCYYTENTYTLTINYGSDENCSKTIANPTTYDGLKAGDVQTHEIKSTIGELTNPKLGTASNAFKTKPTLKDNKLSATMPSKNVEVCIVYTPKTGASWIYLVWVIGGLALGYSIWYFVRYYKKQNSEI